MSRSNQRGCNPSSDLLAAQTRGNVCFDLFALFGAVQTPVAEFTTRLLLNFPAQSDERDTERSGDLPLVKVFIQTKWKLYQSVKAERSGEAAFSAFSAPEGLCRIILPSFITTDTRSVAVMSAVGSPRTAITSASFPLSSVPTFCAIPKSSASLAVADFNASIGFMPRSTINLNSFAFCPCGYTAASVPNEIFTPSFNALRNMSERAAVAAFAFACSAGG